MGLDHPALQDSDEALLATYLEGYDPADVDQLWERGWVKIRPEEDPRPKALLRSEAMLRLGQDPVPDAHDAPPDDDHLVVLTPKSHHFLNSTAVNHARLRTMAGGPSVLLAAADAAARDVADGELVELSSDTGTMTVTAPRRRRGARRHRGPREQLVERGLPGRPGRQRAHRPDASPTSAGRPASRCASGSLPSVLRRCRDAHVLI